MKEPTQEQVEGFWEWCGFQRAKFQPAPDDIDKYRYEAGWWMYPDNIMGCQDLPPINLNNLFKYAVPKAQSLRYNIRTYTYSDGTGTDAFVDSYFNHTDIVKRDKDPALALFWALWQVKEALNEK